MNPEVFEHESAEHRPVFSVRRDVGTVQALRGPCKLLGNLAVHIHPENAIESPHRASIHGMNPDGLAVKADLDLFRVLEHAGLR